MPTFATLQRAKPPRSGLWCRSGLVAVAVSVLTVLGACELMQYRGAPSSPEDCETWRAGCPATIDFTATRSSPNLTSEDRLDRNEFFAAEADKRKCREFPLGCQIKDLPRTIDDGYIHKNR